MAIFNNFQAVTEPMAKGVHNLGTNTLKGMLTNVAPVATNTVKAEPNPSLFSCPCCGSSTRLSMFHRVFTNHRRHIDDFYKAFTP